MKYTRKFLILNFWRKQQHDCQIVKICAMLWVMKHQMIATTRQAFAINDVIWNYLNSVNRLDECRNVIDLDQMLYMH